jgi:ketosteroid isomerase-like protein
MTVRSAGTSAQPTKSHRAETDTRQTKRRQDVCGDSLGHATTGTRSTNATVPFDDTVVALGNYSWDHKASGQPAEVKMVHVWKVADGRLTDFQQHTDTARVRDLIA